MSEYVNYNTKAKMGQSIGNLMSSLAGGYNKQQELKDQRARTALYGQQIGFSDPNRPIGEYEMLRAQMEAKAKALAQAEMLQNFLYGMQGLQGFPGMVNNQQVGQRQVPQVPQGGESQQPTRVYKKSTVGKYARVD